MAYEALDLSAVTNANTTIDIINGVDQAAASQLGGVRPLPILLLATIYVIIVIRALRTVPGPDASTAASTVCLVVSLIFASPLVAWTSWVTVVAVFLLWTVSAVAMYSSKSAG